MNKLSFLILSAAIALSACSKKDNGPVNNGVVGVAIPQECAGPQSTNGEYYNDFEAAGCSAYGWERGHFRHGGCPRGTFAACGTDVGMICVPQDVYRDHSVAWFNYQDGARSLAFCGYEGAANPGSCSYRSVAGAGQIGRACIVGRVGECGPGICTPIDDIGRNRRDDRNARRNHGRRHANTQVGVCVQ